MHTEISVNTQVQTENPIASDRPFAHHIGVRSIWASMLKQHVCNVNPTKRIQIPLQNQKSVQCLKAGMAIKNEPSDPNVAGEIANRGAFPESVPNTIDRMFLLTSVALHLGLSQNPTPYATWSKSSRNSVGWFTLHHGSSLVGSGGWQPG